LLHFGEGRSALVVGLIWIESTRTPPAGVVDGLLDLCLLVVGKFEFGDHFRTDQRLHTFALQLQLLQTFELLGIENLGNLFVALLVRLLGFLAGVGKTLRTLFLTQVLHLAKVAKCRSHLLLHLALQVTDIGLLIVAEFDFLLDSGHSEQHQQAGALHPARSKTWSAWTAWATGPTGAGTTGAGTTWSAGSARAAGPRPVLVLGGNHRDHEHQY